jgi:hypothetical protein
VVPPPKHPQIHCTPRGVLKTRNSNILVSMALCTYQNDTMWFGFCLLLLSLG